MVWICPKSETLLGKKVHTQKCVLKCAEGSLVEVAGWVYYNIIKSANGRLAKMAIDGFIKVGAVHG